MTHPLTLYAQDLWSKFGFGDGDEISDRLFDLGVKLGDDAGTADAVLAHLVKTYLLPILPEPVEVEIWGASHNPLRATTYPHAPKWAQEFGPPSVVVTDEELLSAYRHVTSK